MSCNKISTNTYSSIHLFFILYNSTDFKSKHANFKFPRPNIILIYLDMVKNYDSLQISTLNKIPPSFSAICILNTICFFGFFCIVNVNLISLIK